MDCVVELAIIAKEQSGIGCDADLATVPHAVVMRSKMDHFRNDPVKERRIKRELLKILASKDEVGHVSK